MSIFSYLKKNKNWVLCKNWLSLYCYFKRANVQRYYYRERHSNWVDILDSIYHLQCVKKYSQKRQANKFACLLKTQAKSKSFTIVKEISPLVWKCQTQVRNCTVQSRVVDNCREIFTPSVKVSDSGVKSA